MGGLVAALIQYSKGALNYLYISGINFYHNDATSNHGHEVFNMEVRLTKSENSLFGDFTVRLFAEYLDERRFQIYEGKSQDVNGPKTLNFDISQNDRYPKFCTEHGVLKYKTLNPKPENMGPNGMASSPETFEIPKLILQYDYSFESRLYRKVIVVKNSKGIAAILKAPGKSETDWVEYGEH